MSIIKKNNNANNFPTFLNDFFGDELFSLDSMNRMKNSTPATNIKEFDDKFLLELAAPGKEKSDFNIELDNDVLTISSEKEISNENDDNYTKREYSYESFKRSFSLFDNVDKDNIKATYKNGVLMIDLPKLKEEKQKIGRSIEVS